MNEIGVQQASTAVKTQASAPDTKVGKPQIAAVPTQSQAEVSQADTASEAKAKQTAESKQQQDAAVEDAVAKLNDYVQNTERKLEFQVDDDSGETVVKVFDKGSQELIRQIPNEEALALSQRLNMEEPLMLFSAKV